MTGPLRLLVTGSRDTVPTQDRYVEQILSWVCGPVLAAGRQVIIVNGRCPRGGVDRAAERWAVATDGAEPENHPAAWHRHGKAAGMIRNGHMVGLGADLCLAFPAPGSRGTWDCLKQAADAGILGRTYPLPPRPTAEARPGP